MHQCLVWYQHGCPVRKSDGTSGFILNGPFGNTLVKVGDHPTQTNKQEVRCTLELLESLTPIIVE